MVRETKLLKTSSPAVSSRSKESGAKKRKSSVPTKKMIQKRAVFEKKQARAVKKEQERATKTTAISRLGFKRLVKEIINDEFGSPKPLASKALTILHAVSEEMIIQMFNESSFMLEFAAKKTLTPRCLKYLRNIESAQKGQPVYHLPAREAPVKAEAADSD